MKTLDLADLTKLKIALVAPNRIIGVNYGCGYEGETDVAGDWKELRDPNSENYDSSLSMLLEPLYLLMGENFQDYADSYKVDATAEGEAKSAILASEPLTENGEEWLHIEFGEIVMLERSDGKISKTVKTLNL